MKKLFLRMLIAGLPLCATAAMQSQQAVDLDPVRVKQIAAMLSAAPHGLDVPCSNRTVWASRTPELEQQIHQAEHIAAEPMPAWSDEDYLDFSRTGQRPRGEAMLHARQERVAPLVLAECAEWKGRFLPALTATLNGLAEQPTWTLPAHDADLNSFHRKQYRVELNSAVLADDLAETLYLLGDAISKQTQQHVRDAILERTIQPARAIYAGRQKEFWLRGDSNWNAVCLDGVTGAALTLLPGREDRAYFAAVAEAYSQNYLKSFTSDGYSEEGIGYWSYGFTHYALLRETLWNQTHGGIDLFRNELAQQIALFPRRFQMLPGVMADFADARFNTHPNIELIAYADRAYGLGPQATPPPQPPFGSSLAAVVTAWNLAPPIHLSNAVHVDASPLRFYFPVAGVLVSRPAPQGGIAITIKAGGNGGHSHNDIGSFSIGLGKEQLLGDPGGPMFYSADTFSSRRFESKLLNSYGHPVPVIGGVLQKDATTVKPRVMKTQFTDNEDLWELDMTPVYAASSLRSFTRTLKHARAGQGSIEIVDRFDLTRPTTIEESLPTHGKVQQVDARTFLFTSGGETVHVIVNAPSALAVRQERIDEYGNPFLRIGLATKLNGKSEIRMLIEPVRGSPAVVR